ncbi:hypothetical protein PPACK8108_LOCUS10253 [Phakopsora pachyrhizi]|uniref:Uncharacterized protein n=1 Tax=Phakopsora pachyrhizi TaxID=170000 RepID=A0AAV0AYK4_PHAPC|nr:hypothetical protein PPACK8108_LOCUS10253 [Phakopsora pachyrhizi]
MLDLNLSTGVDICQGDHPHVEQDNTHKRKAIGSLLEERRRAITLPVTSAASFKGVPIAPYLNVGARAIGAHGDDHGHSGSASVKSHSNFQVPRFGACNLVNSTISGIISQMSVQAIPTLAHQQQFGSSSRIEGLAPTSGPGIVRGGK